MAGEKSDGPRDELAGWLATDLVEVPGPLEWVRSNPERLFLSGRPCPIESATRVASDALLLGATDVQIVRQDDIWAVAADHDWLATGGPAIEQFHRIVPFPELGPNSMRQEIILTAFAEAVGTVTGSARTVITGSDEVWGRGWEILNQVRHRQRVVVFVWAGS